MRPTTDYPDSYTRIPTSLPSAYNTLDSQVKHQMQQTWQVSRSAPKRSGAGVDDQARRDDRSSGCAFLTIETCQVFPSLLPLPTSWLESHLRQQVRSIFQRGCTPGWAAHGEDVIAGMKILPVLG